VRVDTTPSGELERLYRDQRDRMWRAVFAFAGDPDVASDAVAEAFTQALRRGDALHSPERWLWRTIFRIAAGELKERGRLVAERVECTYEMDDLARDLMTALAELSEKQRAAVIPLPSLVETAVRVPGWLLTNAPSCRGSVQPTSSRRFRVYRGDKVGPYWVRQWRERAGTDRNERAEKPQIRAHILQVGPGGEAASIGLENPEEQTGAMARVPVLPLDVPGREPAPGSCTSGGSPRAAGTVGKPRRSSLRQRRKDWTCAHRGRREGGIGEEQNRSLDQEGR
jgi:hypothetical protein